MAEFPYCDMICSGNTVGSETIMIGIVVNTQMAYLWFG